MSDERQRIEEAARKAARKGTPINPESPQRLRECLTALAKHEGLQVLRVEVSLAQSTMSKGDAALTMVVTHSLGIPHEQEIAPKLAAAFGEVMSGLAQSATHNAALDACVRALKQASSTNGDTDPWWQAAEYLERLRQ
jgi:acetylglutamate synthase